MAEPESILKLDVRFPLPDGRTLVQGPFSYNQDGLTSRHNADFMRDPRFVEAYRAAMLNAPTGTHIEWRVHVALWCANLALSLPGDFVECGVHTAILSTAVMSWTDFAKHLDRKFYLFDTWSGIPSEQISQEEQRMGIPQMNRKYQHGDAIHAGVVSKVAPWPNCIVVRGRVPDSLSAMQSSHQVAYASIDMNVAMAEIAAGEFLWPRLVPGAPLLIDDYGWASHAVQKRAWDEFARKHAVMILSLPTGQGLILKPH
jgi:O-methyltransferase